MRYYGVFKAGNDRDVLVGARVCKAAADKLRRRLEEADPGALYFVCWNPRGYKPRGNRAQKP